MASLEWGKYDTVMAAYMNGLLKNANAVTDSLERSGMKKLPRDVILHIIKATFDFDAVTELKKYPRPVIIIGGPAENQPGALHTFSPKLPYNQVPGTSHWIQLDKPDEFNNLLDTFLQKAARKSIFYTGVFQLIFSNPV